MSDIFFGFTGSPSEGLTVLSSDQKSCSKLNLSLNELLSLKKNEIAAKLQSTSSSAGDFKGWKSCVDQQAVFASGYTFKIDDEKMERLKAEGSMSFKTHLSDRPMIFFKGFPGEIVGQKGFVGLKASSKRMIPEAEVAILFNRFAEPVAVSVGNDMTAVDIEKENPIYQSYSKFFKGSVSVGPCWRWLGSGFGSELMNDKMNLLVERKNKAIVSYEYSLADQKRSFENLAKYLFEDREFLNGVVLLYGCNHSLPPEFSLQKDDVVTLGGSFLPEPLINYVG